MATDWPRYESHKIVQATPIVAISRSAVGFPAKLYVDPSGTGAHEEFEPTEPAMANRAEIGGYAVIYEGGFKSVSPKQAFEDGYARIQSRAVTDLTEAEIDTLAAGRMGPAHDHLNAPLEVGSKP